jgi:quinol monooxygenase YgiN
MTKAKIPMDNRKIYLLAELTVLPEFLDEVKAALAEALIPTLQEPGCEALFETSREDNPHKLIFFEIFSSPEAHKFHLEQDLGLFFGVRYWTYASTHEDTDDAYVTGNTHQISSRITGTVEQVLVDDNWHITAGQPLLKLDRRDYEVTLTQARASYLQAKAQLVQATTLDGRWLKASGI